MTCSPTSSPPLPTPSANTSDGPAAPAATLIGLGVMGAHLARNLSRAGYQLTLVDAAPAAADALASALSGARASELTSWQGDGPSTVVLMLPSSRDVESVLAVLAPRLAAGSFVIDMGSSDPNSTRRLAADLSQEDVLLVDAPVSGGPGRAATGQLTIMVGGDGAGVARARPLLLHLGSSLHPTGPVGSAHALKALNNMLSAVGLASALEVLAVGAGFGLDPAVMLDVINVSTGRNHATEFKIGQQVLTGAYNVGFSLPLTVKDLGIALALADAQDMPLTVGRAAAALYREALEALGDGQDQSDVARYLAALSGVDLAAPGTTRQPGRSGGTAVANPDATAPEAGA